MQLLSTVSYIIIFHKSDITPVSSTSTNCKRVSAKHQQHWWFGGYRLESHQWSKIGIAAINPVDYKSHMQQQLKSQFCLHQKCLLSMHNSQLYFSTCTPQSTHEAFVTVVHNDSMLFAKSASFRKVLIY